MAESNRCFWKRLTAPPDADSRRRSRQLLVDTLFKDTRSLFLGSLATSTTALIKAWKTGEQALYLCSVAIVIVAWVGALDVHAYGKRRPLLATSEEARRWEQRYVFGAAAHVLLMGLWCLAAFAKTSDPFVQISSLSLTALAAAKLPTSRLEIEITESVFLNDTELTRHWLDELQEMGVRISLDDFGTGYSSFGYLLPAQQGEDRPLLSAGRRHQR